MVTPPPPQQIDMRAHLTDVTLLWHRISITRCADVVVDMRNVQERCGMETDDSHLLAGA